jgi:hypothetical protein
MTTQTKVFIELSDIIGLRLQCKQCGCSLLLETAREDGTINNLMAAANVVLTKCPTCANEWTQTSREKMGDSEAKEFFRALQTLKKIQGHYGCTLSLELAQPPEES